jgi:hypothetical protein
MTLTLKLCLLTFGILIFAGIVWKRHSLSTSKAQWSDFLQAYGAAGLAVAGSFEILTDGNYVESTQYYVTAAFLIFGFAALFTTWFWFWFSRK